MRLKAKLLGAALGWFFWMAVTPAQADLLDPCEPEDWNCDGHGNGIVLINTDGFRIDTMGNPWPITPYVHWAKEWLVNQWFECEDYDDTTQLWLGSGYRESTKDVLECWDSAGLDGTCQECLYVAMESEQCYGSAPRTWDDTGLTCEVLTGPGGPGSSTFDVLCQIQYQKVDAVNPTLRFMVADPTANPPVYRELILTDEQIDEYQPRVPGEDTLIVVLDDLPAGICPNFLKHYNIELSLRDEVCGLLGPHQPLYTGDIENYHLWLNRTPQGPVMELTLWGDEPSAPCSP